MVTCICTAGAASLVLVLCLAVSAAGTHTTSPKSILYIVVDDLRNELAFTNARKGLITPNLDKLAANSMIFDRAYVQQGVCSPSRNSFLSGRRPDTTQVWNFENSFRETLGNKASSWPGAFKSLGWHSVGMGKVYHPGHPKNDDGKESWSLKEFPYYHPSNFATNISDAPDNTFQDGMTTDVALDRLRQLHNRTDDKPFFMAVGLHKPHIPWVMPQRFLDQQLPLEQTDTAVHDTPPQGYCNVSLYICDNVYTGLPWAPASKADQQDHRRKYRAAVSWTDYNVGRMLDLLADLGMQDSTMIIFHGDHGWHLGEQGAWCKQSNFDLVARVPLLVHVPWLPQSQGKRTSAMVELVDLMPTTLDLMGYAGKIPDWTQLEGSSFKQLLLSPETSTWKNATFTQYPRCQGSSAPQLPAWEYPSDNACTAVSSSGFEVMGYSIRSADWRYTLWVGWNGKALKPDWSVVHGEELYDHTGDDGTDTDKFDNVNVADESAHAGLKAGLKAALIAGWRASVPATAKLN